MTLVSTSFAGTENPLSEGGVWSALTAYWQHVTKVNGLKVDGAVLGNDCAARYTGVTFSADQFAEITLAAAPTGGQLFFHYVMVRMNATAGCYLLSTAADVSTTAMQLYRLDNAGTYTQIGTNIGAGSSLAAGNVLRLEVVGTTLTVKLNQGSGFTTLRTATDSTLASGQPGVGGWAQNSTSNVVLVSLWSAGDIAAIDDGPATLPLPAISPMRSVQAVAAAEDDLPSASASTIADDETHTVTLPAPLWSQSLRTVDIDELPGSGAASPIVDDGMQAVVQTAALSVASSIPCATGEDFPGVAPASGSMFDEASTPSMLPMPLPMLVPSRDASDGEFPVGSAIDDSAGAVVQPRTMAISPIRAAADDELLPFNSIFPLTVSSDGRHLVQANGQPFLICADTTWSLFVDIPLASINTYLATITGQGFNAVMGNTVEHHYTVVKPPKERGGLLPFTQRLDGSSYTGSPNGTNGAVGTQGQFAGDPYSNINNQSPDWTFPNNSYWLNVETILDACLQSNVAVFVWAAYLGFQANDEGWINEMVALDAVIGAGGFTGQPWADPTKSKLWNYGAWLANRWKAYPHIIWVMGGDYGTNTNALTTAQRNAVNNVMAGLKSVAGQQSTLFTAHWDRPCVSTDVTLTAGAWDLNLAYTGEEVAQTTRLGYAATPAIPSFLGEDFYEGSSFGGSTPFRKYMYWGFLGGIAGGFYGHEQLWRFDDGTPGTDWTTLLATTARNDAVRQFAFWKSRPWHRLKPSGLGGMGTLITSGGGTASPQSTTYVAAACTPEGDLLLAYIPPAHTGTITVDMTKLAAPASAKWFDPTNASFTTIGTIANTGTHVFTPPGTNSAGDTDFLLVLDATGSPPDDGAPSWWCPGVLSSAIQRRGVEDESLLSSIVDDDPDPPVLLPRDWPISRALTDEDLPIAAAIWLDEDVRQPTMAAWDVALAARTVTDEDLPSQVVDDAPWTFAVSWSPAPLLGCSSVEEFPGTAAPPPTFGSDDDQPVVAWPLPWMPAPPLFAPSSDDLVVDVIPVDPTTAWEDAIYQWVLTGSGLAPSQVIWADVGNGGPAPAGLYISMRIIDVDQVSDDWLIPRRLGGAIVHHVRGTRHPMLELRCFAGESTGARRAELVLARVMAAVMLPSVTRALRRGDVGVGTASKVRVIPGVRSGMLDPLAMVEVQLHIKIDVSETGGEFTSVGVTTPGGVVQTVEKP